MGWSRRTVAAAIVLVSYVATWAAVGAAPAGAAARKPQRQPPGPSWNVPVGGTVRIEPALGSEGVHLPGIGTYPGAVDLVRRSSGRLAVVNEVPFETYVRGISEVPNAWPGEALKAQAIAARTYALWELRRGGAGAYAEVGAHICATQGCQVYTGLAKVRSEGGERWAAAVDATAGEVLWWRDGPIVAKYSSSNGGESVPGGQPYLRAVPDPDDAFSPLHRWRVTVPAADIATALGYPGKQVTAIQRVGDEILVTAKAAPYDPAEEPSHVTLHAVEFREQVNERVAAPDGVPRTLPTVRFGPALVTDPATESLQVVFDGRGWGHGIGLSQWGAFGKANRGMKAPEILASYYAGLKPVALPAAYLPSTIRVAVELDAPAVSVAPADEGGRIRITASDGQTLTYGATTPWTVRATSAGFEVRGAATDAAPAAVTLAGQKVTDGWMEVRLRLSHDAQLALAATAPGSPAAAPIGTPAVFAAGEVVVGLPVPAADGNYVLSATADRGGGRVTTTSIEVPTGASSPAGPSAVAREATVAAGKASFATAGASKGRPAGIPLSVLAVLSFLTVLAGTARTFRRAAATLGRSAVGQLH